MSTVVSVVLALFGLLAAALLGALWLVLKAAVSQEAASVLPAATRSLLHRAKMRLPLEAQPRWEEEWPAGFHNAIEKRPIWALRESSPSTLVQAGLRGS
jgi:Na+-translocating ferredoxin:NAD+ oxidoreductase RnfG subunit